MVCGVWEDAAQKILSLGKHASEITTTEAASIAAILKSPSYYNPIDRMDHSIGTSKFDFRPNGRQSKNN